MCKTIREHGLSGSYDQSWGIEQPVPWPAERNTLAPFAASLTAAPLPKPLAARRKNILDDIVREIIAAGGTAIAVKADVSNANEVADIHKAAIDAFSRIDVWVNNVSVGAIGFFWDIPIEDHARLVDVNLKGLIHGAHAALRQFRIQGYGTLLNIGSIDSEVPLALQNTYAATKAGILSLSRSLNEELRLAGEDDIKVGTIMPWAVDTPWWTHAANYTGHEPRMAMMDDPEIVIDAIIGACLHPKEEQPVGWKAKTSNISHHLMPDLTEKLSADIAKKESDKASPRSPNQGAIHQPVQDGQVDGGIRARMREEDDR
ncbi:short-subunit dehydrogenase [Rhizobium wenxiniae]|uniref:Short-subunit dehydrogenase n=1 Tax=Rhizobium wenxiniae TaxID=1737357 RepID=A0A7W9YE76_9HYPH|nr:short-subunit dehydrogenase [Rhizobium wenxiniae]